MEDRTPKRDHLRTGDRGGTYRRALDACSRVAREEFSVAKAALDDAEQLGVRLKASVATIARRSPADGAAVEDARARLQELEAKLEATLSSSLRSTRAGLNAKHAALNHFTVTLFGRTMAGKSTIREAFTVGDGSTIGNGAQRTTRDVREYTWNSLRIIDTPGIGAYEGDEDRALALSVIDETDVVLFLVSSDGIQEESFKGMQALRHQNKPMLFVLNVKRDLQKPVFMRRFLADPRSVIEDAEMQGHIDRVHRLAGELLGMRNIRVIPIHAQAAYFSTRPEHQKYADVLAEHSRLGELLTALEAEVQHRGTVRRVQTVVDGTLVSLLDLQEELSEQAKTVKRAANYLKDKFGELDIWLDGFVRSANARAETEATQLVQPLRGTVSAFVDENIEREDVAARWRRKVKALKVDDWLQRQQSVILDELRGRLTEFSREMSVESKLVAAFDAMGPSTFDPWDVKRTLRRLSAGGAALAGVASVAFWLGGGNFWNPVGWVAGAVGVVALGLSWLFGDREQKLQRQKAKAAEQLRGSIDELERQVAGALKKWFYDSITSRLVRGIRNDTRQLYTGMFDVARTLDEGAREVGTILEHLNRRLLVRTGQFVGTPVPEERLARVVRDPGVRTKFLWQDEREDDRFCKQVGIAIGEWVDGIPNGPAVQQVASALRPAVVSPAKVSLSTQRALVRVPQREVGKAIGRSGSNVSLASRLVGVRIKVIPEES
ncbi:GTPase [Pyxidicoccus xibeiensis]|uniref:GTPase n=1 Tax=Pyxidicoccus xibeiensis TaxID=2906759 RepID=UPI0020A7422D|nr:GTPase [Pyxidicoccus xibeiensis]MCP3144532.1 50S ribosome-binding GTPase [Pyxidicoccus xibeiensis]